MRTDGKRGGGEIAKRASFFSFKELIWLRGIQSWEKMTPFGGSISEVDVCMGLAWLLDVGVNKERNAEQNMH